MKNLNDYKKRFNILMESTMGNVKPLIMEEENDDLIGKSVTFKVDENLTIKGIIKNFVKQTSQSNNIIFHLEDNIVAIQPLKNSLDGDNDDPNREIYEYSAPGDSGTIVRYECGSNTFILLLSIRITKFENYKVKLTNNTTKNFKATCEGLKNILEKRYPCSTDLSLNKKEEFKNLS